MEKMTTDKAIDRSPVWKVERIRYRRTRGYGRWVAHPNQALHWWEDDKSKTFETHSEALSYADKQARTIEVTMPRTKKYGKQKVAGTGLTSLHVDYRPFATAIYLGGWGDLIIENADLEPLVMHLLARIHARKC